MNTENIIKLETAEDKTNDPEHLRNIIESLYYMIIRPGYFTPNLCSYILGKARETMKGPFSLTKREEQAK